MFSAWHFGNSTPSKRASKSVTQSKRAWHKSLCAPHVWQTQNCTTTNVKEEQNWIDEEEEEEVFWNKVLLGRQSQSWGDTHLMKQRKLFVEERDVEKGRQQNMCVISLHHFWLQKCVSTTTSEPQFFCHLHLISWWRKVHLGWFATDSPNTP